MSTRAVVNFYNEYEPDNRRRSSAIKWLSPTSSGNAARDARGRFRKGRKKRVRTLAAKIYRHGDGYPGGLGKDLKEFLNLVKATLRDTRFNDASYLAAKWVVHDSARMAKYQNFDTNTNTYGPVTNPLQFLSVGIITKDPSDIDYSYDVICNAEFSDKETMPKIICHKVPFK